MSNDDDDIDFDNMDPEEAMAQLLEAQNEIDEKAKRSLESLRRYLVVITENLVPGFNKKFAKAHGEWYATVEKSIVAAGFTPLGQWQNADPGDTPDERQSYYHFALGDDGAIIASWFSFVGPEKPMRCVVLQTYAENGKSCVTESGITPSGMPPHPDETIKAFPEGASVAGMVKVHRGLSAQLGAPAKRFTDMTGIMAERHADTVRTVEFRKSVDHVVLAQGMLDQVFGKGDEYAEELMTAIKAHPEWWTGEAPAQPTIDASEPPQFMFLMSRDEDTEEGRVHVTTAGLAMRGLPEMQMKELAANHCRGARLLMGITAMEILKYAASLPPSDTPMEERLSGIELPVKSHPIHPVDAPLEEVVVALEMEEFGGKSGQLANMFSVILQKKKAAMLLRVKPPKAWSGSADEWLRDACRRLSGGTIDIPAPLPWKAFPDTMDAASKRAVANLPELRHRIKSGLPPGHFAVVKWPLTAKSGGREFVWVKVTDAPPGEFVGTLAVQPADVDGYELGQTVRVPDAEVFDRGIFSEDQQVIQPPVTDDVAQDFGVDLPQQ